MDLKTFAIRSRRPHYSLSGRPRENVYRLPFEPTIKCFQRSFRVAYKWAKIRQIYHHFQAYYLHGNKRVLNAHQLHDTHCQRRR